MSSATMRRPVGTVGALAGGGAKGVPASNRAFAGSVDSLTGPVGSTHGHAYAPKKAGLPDRYSELGMLCGVIDSQCTKLVT